MSTNPSNWGYVGLKDSLCTDSASQEAHEMAMLRCHYGRKKSVRPVSLAGYLPVTDRIIYNPCTLQDLATLFETNIELAFS